MDSYTTVKEYGSFEYEDRKSVFIGECIPVSSEDEAQAFISRVKKKYSDARHHVYAYVLRSNSLMRFSDDREPQGTAGMPVLDVIRKNGCTDTAIVVTRYFGGTLLGTGGLVKAYTSAALGALQGANVITYDIYVSLKISVSYSDYQKIASRFSDMLFFAEDTQYADTINVFGKIKKENADSFTLTLSEITAGRCEIELIEEKFDFLP